MKNNIATKELLIPYGKHRPRNETMPKLYFTFKDHVEVTRTIGINAQSGYVATTEPPQVNKLIGISLGHHHRNSIRLGWSFERVEAENMTGYQYHVNFYGYAYRNGERQIDHIYTDYLGKTDNMRVTVGIYQNNTTLTYGIKINGSDIYRKQWMRKKKRFMCGYELKPYFGGKNPAPSTIRLMASYSEIKSF